jgi:hypothetical protein
MHDFPRQKLCSLISRHGTILCEDAERCESFLRNLCGEEYYREIFVLIIAIKEGVTKELLGQPLGLPSDAVLNRLAQHLHDNLCLEKKAAQWAVQSWKIALGLGVEKPVQTNPVNEELTQLLVSEPVANIQSEAALIAFPKKPLSHLNPLDYFRLLWWVLVAPHKLQAYRKTFGQENEKQIGNWLVSILIWWPLLIPCLGIGLKQLPYSEKAWLPEIYLLLSVMIFGAWLLTGGLKINKDVATSVAGLVSVSMAVLVSISIAGIVFSLKSSLISLSVATLVSVALAGIVIIMGTVLISVLVAGDAAIVIAGVVAIGMAVGVAGSVAFLMADLTAGFIASNFAGFVASIGVDLIGKVMGNTMEKSLNTGIPSSMGHLIFLLLIIAYLFLMGLFIGLHNL